MDFDTGLNDTAWERVLMARKMSRFRSIDIINNIFHSFVELHGDRGIGDDKSIVCGPALLDDLPVTIIGQQKGNNQQEMEYRQYGMTKPEGYRKALRMMRQAEKFRRPIICFIDTPGAYPGISAEEHGQAEAIARNLYEMANFTVPILSIIIGEGGSGGALALAVANSVIMLENAIYSVVSPEGCASILCKDSRKAPEMANDLKLTANNLKEYGIIDGIISEEGDIQDIYLRIKNTIITELSKYEELSGEEIRKNRKAKFRSIGQSVEFFNEINGQY
ncbi:MAG: acetyl-CoA carboxylase carboxyltransferase subunit alpha [Anaerocolumna sp.]|jgi:acetyl-CoA carboxylase carboxyl transferase alpha subunit|nr:acetyl-CoA carboxylase carboxyltransferase subunit alpha [Anaerocolumna sp.]